MHRFAAGAVLVLSAVPVAVGATAIAPRTATAQSERTRAVLVYFPYLQDYGRPHPRLTILRNGRRRFVETVPPSPRDNFGRQGRVIPFTLRGGAETKPLAVRDLDGDREPEVLLDLFWGGTRCCLWTRVYRFDGTKRRYVPTNHFWGNFQDTYRLRDLEGDGRPEFVSADGRIERISSVYYSSDPIQIWSFDHGRFRDVTRRYPGRVAQDARQWWAEYIRGRRAPLRNRVGVREPLSAWVADEYLLRHSLRADRVVAAALRHGELDLPLSAHAVSARRYVEELKAFLRSAGYA